MRVYRKYCEVVGLSPKPYGVACIVCILANLTVWAPATAVWPYSCLAYLWLPLMMAPFLAVMVSVMASVSVRATTRWEGFWKMQLGSFVTMFLVWLPSGFVGGLLWTWLGWVK